MTPNGLMKKGDHFLPLPIWIRAPKGEPEYYTGFSRSKLYDLAARKIIRSARVIEPGKATGTRLFFLQSILDYIEKAEAESAAKDLPVESSE